MTFRELQVNSLFLGIRNTCYSNGYYRSLKIHFFLIFGKEFRGGIPRRYIIFLNGEFIFCKLCHTQTRGWKRAFIERYWSPLRVYVRERPQILSENAGSKFLKFYKKMNSQLDKNYKVPQQNLLQLKYLTKV